MSQPQAKPVTQEVLQNLERECQNRLQELNAAHEDLCKVQATVIAAQEALFKAYHVLSANKEKYLSNVVNQLQTQTQTYVTELNALKQRGSIEVLPSERPDNV